MQLMKLDLSLSVFPFSIFSAKHDVSALNVYRSVVSCLQNIWTVKQ